MGLYKQLKPTWYSNISWKQGNLYRIKNAIYFKNISTSCALYVKCECHGNSTRIVTGHLVHHDKWSCNIWFVWKKKEYKTFWGPFKPQPAPLRPKNCILISNIDFVFQPQQVALSTILSKSKHNVYKKWNKKFLGSCNYLVLNDQFI